MMKTPTISFIRYPDRADPTPNPS